jgi:hypothetical protein
VRNLYIKVCFQTQLAPLQPGGVQRVLVDHRGGDVQVECS